MPRKIVKWESFVYAWEHGDSTQDVAFKLGMKVSSVANRVFQYRQKGVNLKRMPRKNKKGVNNLHVDQINAYINSLQKVGE